MILESEGGAGGFSGDSGISGSAVVEFLKTATRNRPTGREIPRTTAEDRLTARGRPPGYSTVKRVMCVVLSAEPLTTK